MAEKFKYIISLLVLFITIIPVFAQDNIIREQYYLNQIQGKKIGYSSVVQKEVSQNGERLFLTHKHSEKRFKHFGVFIEQVQDSKFYEDKNLNPVMLEVSNVIDGKKIEYMANFLPNSKVIVKYQNGKNEEVENILLKEKVLFPMGESEFYRLKNQEGILEYSNIDVEKEFNVVNIKAVKQRQQGKYNIYLDILPNMKNEQYRDKRGYLVKEYSPLMDIEKVVVPKKLMFPNAENLFYKSRLPIDGTLDNVKDIKEIIYKVQLDDCSSSEIPDFDSSQRIIQSKDDVAYIKVKLSNYKHEKFRYPPKSWGLKKYLERNDFLDFDNVKIKKLLKNDFSYRKKDSYLLAKKLEKYVSSNIKEISEKININSMSKIWVDKKGDCTDRAIFLAGLLRSLKIPSKLIVGVKYKNNPSSCFEYHAWVSAYVGKWVNLDPQDANENFSVGHIALKEIDFEKDIKKQIFSEFLNKLSSMKISILDFVSLKESSNDDIEKSLKLGSGFSESGLLDYMKHSGMKVDISGLKNKDSDNREFIKLKNIEAKKYARKGVHYYVNADIDKAIINFERVFELTPVNDDYLNIDYSDKLCSIGLFHLAKDRLSNISNHKIWSIKIEDFYKRHLPKNLPEYSDEKLFAKIGSQIKFSPDDIDLEETKKQLSDKKYKKSDYVNYLLSKLYFAKKQEKKAYKYINRALRINPSNFMYHLQKLNILSSRNKYSGALKEIRWLLNNNHYSPEFSYGLTLHQNHIMSKKSWLKSNREYYLAKFYSQSNQNQKAKRILENLVQDGRKKDRTYVLLGKVNYNLGEAKLSKENFLAALSLNKKNNKALEGLGDLNYLKNEPEEALSYYLRAARRNKKSPELMLKIANCYRNTLNERDALFYYFQALRSDNKNYKAIYNIAKIQGKYGSKSDMTAIYKQILSINPEYVPAWFGLVKLAILEKNIFAARQYLKPVLYIDKMNPKYYYYSGLIEVMNENYAYARRDFQRALSLNPNFVRAKFELDRLK